MGFFDLFKKKNKDEKTKKYELGMKKTRQGLMGKLKAILSGYDEISEDLFDDLTDAFIMADIGVETTLDFIEALKEDERVEGIHSAEELQPIIVDKMFELYLKGEIVNNNFNIQKDGLSVFLFVGVNGVGKTTTIAKLSKRYLDMGKNVAICAADTFRAGAVEQLSIWGERLNIPVVKGKENSDPASVAFDGVRYAKNNNIVADFYIASEAGITNLLGDWIDINAVVIEDKKSKIKLFVWLRELDLFKPKNKKGKSKHKPKATKQAADGPELEQPKIYVPQSEDPDSTPLIRQLTQEVNEQESSSSK